MEAQNQMSLRKDGKLPLIYIEAETVAEASKKAILSCYDLGARVETVKHIPGGSLGCDADINILIRYPNTEPKIYTPGLTESALGLVQYSLELTHGIHNHWKKIPGDPKTKGFWGYTYNERFIDQLPFIFQRIKYDWEEKKNQWGNGIGRISGRDYQFTIWRPGEDIILEQDDPPCWQRGHLRFLQNKNGEIVLNYITDWRSRDNKNAWSENVISQIDLFKLFINKISDMVGIPIKMGVYIDKNSSLHLYGQHIDRDDLDKKIEIMRRDTLMERSMNLDNYLINESGKTRTQLKRLIAAQSDAEAKGYGKQQSEKRLIELGYDIDNFPYPEEWDTWPKSWDAEPDITKLARVIF